MRRRALGLALGLLTSCGMPGGTDAGAGGGAATGGGTAQGGGSATGGGSSTGGGGGGGRPTPLLGQRCDATSCRKLRVLVLDDATSDGSWSHVQSFFANAQVDAVSVGAYHEWDGVLPAALPSIDVVLWLEGIEYGFDLLAPGVTALNALLSGGTGLVRTEWAAWAEGDTPRGAPYEVLPVVPSASFGDRLGAARVTQPTHPLARGLGATFSRSGFTFVTAAASAEVVVEAAGLTASDAPASVPLATTSTTAGGGRLVHLNSDVCYPAGRGSTCDLGQSMGTLFRNAVIYAGQGEFADAPAWDGGVADAGEAPFDAGVPDAGAPDAGDVDAGLPDAGVPDAGAPFDAGPDFVIGQNDAGLGLRCDDAGACRPLHALVLNDQQTGLTAWPMLLTALTDTNVVAVNAGFFGTWDGTVPALLNGQVDVVFWMQGVDYSGELTTAGASTLSHFLDAGVGLVRTEWSSWAVASRGDAYPSDVFPVSPTIGYGLTFGDVVISQPTHPLMTGITALESLGQYTVLTPYPGATVVASAAGLPDGGRAWAPQGLPLVTEAQLGNARVVHLNHALCSGRPRFSDGSCELGQGQTTLWRNAVIFAGDGRLP